MSGIPEKSVDSPRAVRESAGRKQAEIAASLYSKLWQDLASATSPKAAARIIGDAADKLLGWDAYGVCLYSEETDVARGILSMDLVDGKRVEFPPRPAAKPSKTARRVLTEGARLILRDAGEGALPGANAFGNTSRPSASMMYVPIRHGDRLIGFLTIQSYTPNAYTPANLETLQDLADRCAGAMERIRAEDAHRQSERQFRLIWESSADGMRLADSEGVILAVNEAYCRMVDLEKSDLEGKPITAPELHEKHEMLMRRFRKQIASGAVRSHREVEATLWNGRKIWFDITDSPLDLPGQPGLMLTIFRDITKRKTAEAEVAELHRRIVDASRQAGMAEIATNVLHNVGNVLNSVNVSAELLGDSIRNSRVSGLPKLVSLLKEHENNLGAFLHSERGAQFLPYLRELARALETEREANAREVESLRLNIAHLKGIVAMQQSYASVSGVRENMDVTDLVEDALRINAGSLSRHGVEIVRDYHEVPETVVDKHKILQILVNLVRNAKYACDESGRSDKRVVAGVLAKRDRIQIYVTDNGAGIPRENLTRIFNHGFTTRKNGHGFGLHGGAIAARELGGTLTAHSDGPGRGATFTLEIPIRRAPVR